MFNRTEPPKDKKDAAEDFYLGLVRRLEAENDFLRGQNKELLTIISKAMERRFYE